MLINSLVQLELVLTQQLDTQMTLIKTYLQSIEFYTTTTEKDKFGTQMSNHIHFHHSTKSKPPISNMHITVQRSIMETLTVGRIQKSMRGTHPQDQLNCNGKTTKRIKS